MVGSGGRIWEQENCEFWRISQWIDWLISRIWRKNMRAGELWVLKYISMDWLISRIWRKNKRAGKLWVLKNISMDWLIDFRIWRKNLRTEEVWLLKSISITRPTELNLEIINSHRFHLNYATRNQKKILQRQPTRQIFLLITRPIEQKQHILRVKYVERNHYDSEVILFFSCFLWKFKEQATG